MTHLITGATGNVGSLVVERLLARGQRPRLFVRDAGKARARFGDRVDVAVGDLADATTLAPALAGIEGLLLINSGPDLASHDEAAAKKAKAAGVRRLVKLSTYDVRERIGTGAWHAVGETAIRASGVPFAFVQPSGFMSNALYWAAAIRAEGIVRSSTGDGRIPFIHPADIADVVVEALTTTKYVSESLPITGPEALSYAEMTAKIGKAIGRQLGYQTISNEQARQQQAKWDASQAMAEARLQIFSAIRDGGLAEVTGEVERILGRRPISFDRWVAENAQAFR